MQHVAGRLVIPGASAAAEIKVLMDSGSSITATSVELVEALPGTAGDGANRVNAGVCCACACGDVGWPGVVIRRGSSMADGMSLPRVKKNGLLHCGQTHSEPSKGSPWR